MLFLLSESICERGIFTLFYFCVPLVFYSFQHTDPVHVLLDSYFFGELLNVT